MHYQDTGRYGPSVWLSRPIRSLKNRRKATEIKTHTRLVLLHNGPIRIRKQKMQHGRVPGNGIWLVPHEDYTLHRGITNTIPQRINPHKQIRLLGRVPKSCPQGHLRSTDNIDLRKSSIHLPSAIVWGSRKSTGLVRIQRNGVRSIQ